MAGSNGGIDLRKEERGTVRVIGGGGDHSVGRHFAALLTYRKGRGGSTAATDRRQKAAKLNKRRPAAAAGGGNPSISSRSFQLGNANKNRQCGRLLSRNALPATPPFAHTVRRVVNMRRRHQQLAAVAGPAKEGAARNRAGGGG